MRRASPWVLLVLQLGIVLFNLGHEKEQGILSGQYLPYAAWILGREVRPVLTYPMWGYPALLALFRSPNVVLFLQALAAVPVLWMVMRRACAARPDDAFAIRVLLIGALPWYFLHAVRWASSPAIALGTAGLALLATGGLRHAAFGGLLMGLAGNFRADWSPLPVLLLLLAAVGSLVRPRFPLAPKRAAVFLGAAGLALAPWVLFTGIVAHHPTPVSTNSGMVGVITLGQLPGNPWGARHEDAYARGVLNDRGHPDVDPVSPEGNRILTRIWKERIQEHPDAFVRKCLWNVVVSIAGGFYMGEPPLSAADRVAVRDVRRSIKALIQEGHRVDSSALTVPALLATAWFLIATLAGALFMLLTAIGLVRLRGGILTDRWLLLSATMIVFGLALASVLQAQPRHMNSLYVFAVPFAVAGGRSFVRRRFATAPVLRG
ncbi:MAG: hypothetical protein E4H17_02955 [Gemmatimonadales bacterium]|nr:MAG: hypothetical protein E4H17_02955 [Gemmatimonadales bacterium]